MSAPLSQDQATSQNGEHVKSEPLCAICDHIEAVHVPFNMQHSFVPASSPPEATGLLNSAEHVKLCPCCERPESECSRYPEACMPPGAKSGAGQSVNPLKRYEPAHSSSAVPGMSAHPFGGYVKYTDYAKEREEFRRVLAACLRCPGIHTTDQVTGETFSNLIAALGVGDSK